MYICNIHKINTSTNIESQKNQERKILLHLLPPLRLLLPLILHPPRLQLHTTHSHTYSYHSIRVELIVRALYCIRRAPHRIPLQPGPPTTGTPGPDITSFLQTRPTIRYPSTHADKPLHTKYQTTPNQANPPMSAPRTHSLSQTRYQFSSSAIP